MELDRRSCVVQPRSRANRQREEPVDEAKPFHIPKRVVWKAFKRVKANRGAAGVDRQSIAEFEADLSNNLYKLWNRMCSGSYFPPPVRRVEISESGRRHGRKLGKGRQESLDVALPARRSTAVTSADSRGPPRSDPSRRGRPAGSRAAARSARRP